MEILFNSPDWAKSIDSTMARGIVESISRPRLARYGLSRTPSAKNDSEVIARHGRNMVLCEAMYPSLHLLEVVMRNSIHDSFRRHYGSDDWYELGWLIPGHSKPVADAKAELAKRRRATDPDRVVAELAFGFWCGMFNSAYESATGPWPHLLKRVLPRVPKSWRTRPKIKDRIEEARSIRNRVFHHESIAQFVDLADRHRKLTELLGWFSPETRRHLEQVCRFGITFADRLECA